MIRFFEQLGCYVGIPLIPRTDILTAETCRLVVNGQEGLDSNTDTHKPHSFQNRSHMAHSNLSYKSVTPQDSSPILRLYEGTEHPDPIFHSLPSNSQAVEQSIGEDAHHYSTNGNTRIVTIDQQNDNSRGTEHIDPELHSGRSTTRVAKQAEFQSLPSNSQAVEQGIGATFQDAHHFCISGNTRIVNIGQQNVHNRGIYTLDNLKEFVSFSALHDSSTQDPERCCHPGTRRTVLYKMRSWMDDPNAPERILWLHGPAGVGKSAIAQTISYSYDQDQLGATFFFFRSDPLRNNGNRLFPTLAWQLALSVPIIKDHIAFSLEKHPDLPRKAIEVQFERLITQPFLTLSGGESTAPTSTRVIIIDGLDECSDVKLQERILKIIGNAVADTHFPLRFVISSRPEAHIQDFFDQFHYPTLQIDLAKVDDAFRDIETYLTFEFNRIAVEQQLDPRTWPDQAIVDTLVSKSSGQFVYASTVMKHVGDKYESAVAQLNTILGLEPSTGKSPFSELDALYTEILQRQPDQNFLKKFLPLLVARSMLASTKDRRLHEDDAILLGLDKIQLHRKLRGMPSLLKFEPFIDVHHRSFLDFLDNLSRSGEYHIGKHFANRRYVQRVINLLVKAASRAMEQPDYHEDDHFQPRFATVIKHFPLPIELPLNDLQGILRPLEVIQEDLLQLPNMSIPWKPRACDECWTFPMIDDLLLHLAWFRGAIQSQEPKYVGIHPLTAMEEKQTIPQLDLDTCLSLLLANLRDAESQLSLNVDTIGLVRALVRFNPTVTAKKVHSITDAQNLVELIFCLNKNGCFKSWFGAAARNATRLAVAIYGRVPLLPRSLFLNSADLDRDEKTYQGKAVKIWFSSNSVRHHFLDAFIWGSLSHGNIGPFLGISSDSTDIGLISLIPESARLLKWRQNTNPSVSKIRQIIFEVAKAIQYVHSLGIVLRSHFFENRFYLVSDNQAKLNNIGFHPSCLSDRWLKDDGCEGSFTMEDNINSFGVFFYRVLVDDGACSMEPEIPDNVWQLIQRCWAEDPKERPTIDQVVQEMESWISLGQFTLLS